MTKFDNILIYLAAFACLIVPVVTGDPLNPGMLGETMDMPLPPDLVQKAVKAGVIKSASQVTGPLPSGSQPMNLGTPTMDSFSASQADAGTYITGTAGPTTPGGIAPQQADGELMLSGTLSLVLQGTLTKYITLIMQQNGNEVAGQGNLTEGSGAQEVTAYGLIEGSTVSLTVRPVGSSDQYTLSFLPEGSILKGSYSTQLSSGETSSGTAIGIMSNPNTNPNTNPNANANPDANPDADANATIANSAPSNPAVSGGGTGATSDVSARAGPVQLGNPGQTGSSYSSTKSISMSSTAGGSMSSSTSISSNMGI